MHHEIEVVLIKLIMKPQCIFFKHFDYELTFYVLNTHWQKFTQHSTVNNVFVFASVGPKSCSALAPH